VQTCEDILFSEKPVSKKVHHTFYVWRMVWGLSKWLERRILYHFSGFFHQIKVGQPIQRKITIQNVLTRIRSYDKFCMKRLQTLKSFKNERLKLKICKPIVVGYLTNTFAMIPLSEAQELSIFI
jgi:hypothetical protein